MLRQNVDHHISRRSIICAGTKTCSRDMPFLLPDWVSLPRTVFHFLARANTFSCGRSSCICAVTIKPAHGICERQIQKHKTRDGISGTFAPVLTCANRRTMCRLLPNEEVNPMNSPITVGIDLAKEVFAICV